MFDLIIAYLVITFIVNTVKTAKDQQKRGTEQSKKTSSGGQRGKYAPYGNKRYPAKKQERESLPKGPVAQPVKTAGPAVICAEERQGVQSPRPQTDKRTKPTIQSTPASRVAVVSAESAEEERLQEILEPTEENILTGLIWSDILGPPVCKRPRRY